MSLKRYCCGFAMKKAELRMEEAKVRLERAIDLYTPIRFVPSGDRSRLRKIESSQALDPGCSRPTR